MKPPFAAVPNKRARQAQVHIRRATLDDARTLAEFNRSMALETENLKLRPAVLVSGVTAVLENPARGFYLVAEHATEHATEHAIENATADAHPVTLASLLVTTEWSDWRNGEFWWLQSVYVVREWRRRGIYRALYRHVQQLAAQAQNVCGFRLYVERDNQVAQKTYAALGMSETGYKMFAQPQPQHQSDADSL